MIVFKTQLLSCHVMIHDLYHGSACTNDGPQWLMG